MSELNVSNSKALPKALPYQASQQIEYLHLHAEIEALLQEMQSLSQQRQMPIESNPSEMLVSAAH